MQPRRALRGLSADAPLCRRPGSRPMFDRWDEPTTISAACSRSASLWETRGGRLLGDELQPALGHRGQIVTDLLEGGLGQPRGRSTRVRPPGKRSTASRASGRRRCVRRVRSAAARTSARTSASTERAEPSTPTTTGALPTGPFSARRSGSSPARSPDAGRLTARGRRGRSPPRVFSVRIARPPSGRARPPGAGARFA